MDKMERGKEFARVMRWLTENEADKFMLIDFDEPYMGEDYIRVIRSLQKASLEYLIPLLLVVEPRRVEFENALQRFRGEALIERWEGLGEEAFLRELESLTREEIMREKLRNEADKGGGRLEKAPGVFD